MIKKLHMIAALLLASALSVFAQSPTATPQLKWASLQDGKGLEIADDITKTTDGNVAIMATFNSAADYMTTEYAVLDLNDLSAKQTEKVFTGSIDEGSDNGNANMVLYKIDVNTGKLMWSINTNICNFEGKGNITATPDNGLLLFLKIRHTSLGRVEAHHPTLIQFVDKDGTLTKVDWPYPSDYGSAPYRPILVKVNAEGKIDWIKHYDVKFGKYMVEGSECNYTDNFNLGGVATDLAGNIYVSGLYRTTIKFGKNANFTTARNAATWNGDSQDKRGDIFVAKLDAKGEAIWGVTSSGDAIICENPKATVVKGDKIYLTGIIQGDPTSKVNFGDIPVQVTEKKSLFVACMSKETGAFEWVKVLESKNNTGCNKAYAKPMNINVDGNNIYLSGSFQGDMMDGENAILSSTVKKLHGYIIKCNAQDGSVLAAVETTSFNKNDILETEAVHAIGNKVFAVGYGLMSNSYLYVYDENLTPESKQEFIVKNSFFGVTGGAAFVDDNIVNITRMKNKATIPGATGTVETVVYNGNNNWGCLYTCHSISDFISMLKLDDDVNYEGAEEMNCDLAIYKRNFTHTKWQSLYLPFDMEYEDWCGMFEVARINDVHEFDDNNDGVIDRTQLEVIILGEGAKTEANVPYMFKAKATGMQKLSAADVFVKPAAPYEHDVTSWNTRFIFHGTYDGVTGDDMFNNKYYAFADGGLKQVSQPVPMKGYRWYLDIQDRAGEKLPTAKAISLIIVDEEGNVTGVEEAELDGNAAAGNGHSAGVYNLQGQKVSDNAADLVGLPKGVYIVNGKKVIL